MIGNNAYRDAPLGNAVNDAKAVATLLENAGFTVTLKTDVTREALREAAAAFGAAARSNETRQVFFYYAGHGAQMDWRNYLLPVDAHVGSGADLPTQCLDLGVLLTDLSKAKGKVFVLILDACRDNPFGASYRPVQKGLSQFDAPAGSLLAFSTAPGSVAADGRDANGLYTQNLVRELSVKGVKLEDALKRVRLAVRVASRGEQVPWESTSLEGDVYLFPTGGRKLSEAELEAEFQRELETWNRVKGSKQLDDWYAYLRAYPSGKFSEIAQTRIQYFLQLEEERRAREVAAASAAAQAAAAAATLAAAKAQAGTVTSSSPAGAAPVPAPSVLTTRRPDLEIGPGLPVPVLMRPSLNPSSAGTYAAMRRFSVGDESLHEVSDPIFGGKQEPARYRVTRVDEDADRVEINRGNIIFDCMGNPIRLGDRIYDPRAQNMPAELRVGYRWTSRFRLTIAGRATESYYDLRVATREMVRVPAGEFDAFKLEGTGFNLTTGARLTLNIWVVPGFNFPLRSERIVQPRGSVTRDGELRELVSCRQMRWSVA